MRPGRELAALRGVERHRLASSADAASSLLPVLRQQEAERAVGAGGSGFWREGGLERLAAARRGRRPSDAPCPRPRGPSRSAGCTSRARASDARASAPRPAPASARPRVTQDAPRRARGRRAEGSRSVHGLAGASGLGEVGAEQRRASSCSAGPARRAFRERCDRRGQVARSRARGGRGAAARRPCAGRRRTSSRQRASAPSQVARAVEAHDVLRACASSAMRRLGSSSSVYARASRDRVRCRRSPGSRAAPASRRSRGPSAAAAVGGAKRQRDAAQDFDLAAPAPRPGCALSARVARAGRRAPGSGRSMYFAPSRMTPWRGAQPRLS